MATKMPLQTSEFDPATESTWAVRLRSHVPRRPTAPAGKVQHVRFNDIDDVLTYSDDLCILHLKNQSWATVSETAIWVSDDLHEVVSEGLIGIERAALGVPEDHAERWRWVLRVEEAYEEGATVSHFSVVRPQSNSWLNWSVECEWISCTPMFRLTNH